MHNYRTHVDPPQPKSGWRPGPRPDGGARVAAAEAKRQRKAAKRVADAKKAFVGKIKISYETGAGVVLDLDADGNIVNNETNKELAISAIGDWNGFQLTVEDAKEPA
jgi:hypothetical protein